MCLLYVSWVGSVARFGCFARRGSVSGIVQVFVIGVYAGEEYEFA